MRVFVLALVLLASQSLVALGEQESLLPAVDTEGNLVEEEEGNSMQEVEFLDTSLSALSQEESTQRLLESARGCLVSPKQSRCAKARAVERQDSKWCLRHPENRSVRCHRLEALEKLLYGTTGTSRVARDLVRQCAGRRLDRKALRRLQRVLIRHYISDEEKNEMLSILHRCDLTENQMLQLKRILRIRQNAKAARKLREKSEILGEELARLQNEDKKLGNRHWLRRLQKLVGPADDVKDKWVNKIMAASKNYDACKETVCPKGSECQGDGKCVKVDLCEKNKVVCKSGFNCKDGQCVEKSCKNVQCGANQRCFRGSCVANTSCKGIRCKSGTRCMNGRCVDLTKPASCDRLQCPAEQTCVMHKDGASCAPVGKPAERKGSEGDKKEDGSDDGSKDAHEQEQKADAEKIPAWTSGQWSECSVPCGQPDGYRTRSVLCKYKDGKIAPDAECEATGQKPKESGDCECPSTAPVFRAEPEEDGSDDDKKSGKDGSCSKRCAGTEKVSDCTSGKCETSTKPCGRPACTAPDYSTIMRVCKGGAWTHCNCPSGYYPLSGGCDGTGWPHRWQYNNWNGANGWLCGGFKGKKTVHVLCAKGMGACKWQTSDGGDWHRQLCPSGSTVLSGGCNALGKPHLLRWQMKSGNGWLCGGWNGEKRTSVLCCDEESMRPGCRTFSRRFGDWGHISCPKKMKLVSGGCDADKPYLIRSSRPINRTTWQCGGWGGNKLITVTCCPEEDDF